MVNRFVKDACILLQGILINLNQKPMKNKLIKDSG